MELAPPPRDGKYYYKGVQTSPNKGVLTEGRYFYNPFYWDWEIGPQFVVTDGKIGVRVSLQGDDLPPGRVLAEPGQKGILREVLKPGRYPYNPYAEKIEEHDPVTVPAGYRGVVTLLAGREPKDPNVILVGEGERGVQKRTLEPGMYYLNPYETRVSLVDCRSKRFNLGTDGGEMDFLSADGFAVTLDGAVEFRVVPDRGRRGLRPVQRGRERRRDRRGDHRQDHHPREPFPLPGRRLEADRRPVHQRRRPRAIPARTWSRA